MDLDRGVCRHCRSSQLASTCCRVGLLRRSPRTRRRTDADAPDHISALHEDLRLRIISHLDCVREAANLSLLSRKWRGIWTHLPELNFHNIGPDQLIAALAQVAHPAGSLKIYLPRHHMLSTACISSILHAAEPASPAKLDVVFWMDQDADTSAAIELPGFDHTTSISLNILPLVYPTLLPTGLFTKLEVLSLVFCKIDLGDMLPRCPNLCKLDIPGWELDSIKVHSPSLRELDVEALENLRVIDISAPLLKKLRFNAIEGTDDDFTLSFSAPLLDDLSWRCPCPSSFVSIWRLWTLKLKTPTPHGRTHLTSNGENSCLQLQQCPHGYTLLLKIGSSPYAKNGLRSFQLDISRIPVSFSILELDISTGQHAYGAVVLKVLGLCTSIQRLKMMLNRRRERKLTKTCPASCHCDQPSNWRRKSITLTYLKEVEVEGFSGEDHEVDLLKVIFRSATMLEGVTLSFARNVSPENCSAYKELPSISKAHPSVKVDIYRWLE